MHVNPSTIEAQMQSAIVYGLTAALKGAIDIQGGRVVQSNFHDYQMLHLAEMPVVEVYIVPSSDEPGGGGEPGTPPIPPAACNAIFAATGKRIRKLPIAKATQRSFPHCLSAAPPVAAPTAHHPPPTLHTLT